MYMVPKICLFQINFRDFVQPKVSLVVNGKSTISYTKSAVFDSRSKRICANMVFRSVCPFVPTFQHASPSYITLILI